MAATLPPPGPYLCGMSLQIITTADGSASLYNPQLDETYHSRHGALQESLHVFINAGLVPAWQRFGTESLGLKVLEIGFGTGLNALLAWQWAQQQQVAVQFVTLEPYPVAHELARQLDYASLLPEEEAAETFLAMHEAPFAQPVQLSPYFTLLKHRTTLEDYAAPAGRFHCVFFDAFAPAKQPEVWQLENLQKCFEALARGGLFTTYCAQGAFKRNLAACGFQIEVLPGPPFKKEMVRAEKI